ncbi:MAG: DnaD domain protein, partial [Saccharofermentans sp.]|nr:DnaD domain protein [Saccharofermentans sp.]
KNSLKERLVKLCSKTLRKHLTELDINRIYGWVDNLNTNEELVAYAFRVNEFRSNPNLKHIEDTLKKWFDLGIDTADKAAKLDEEEHKENARRSAHRKSRSGSKWRTGAEAGIETYDSVPEKTEESKEEKSENKETKATADEKQKSTKGDDSVLDDILDMFGDS